MKAREFRRNMQRANPTFWLFIVGLVAWILGAGLTIKPIKLIGEFIMIIYLVIIIVWVVSNIK